MAAIIDAWNALSEGWQWFFKTVATGAVSALAGLIVHFFFKKKNQGMVITQSQKSGDHSTSIQIGNITKDAEK